MAHRQALRLLCTYRTAITGVSRVVAQCSTVRHAAMPHGHSRLLTASLHTTCRRMNDYIINIQDTDEFKKRVLENSSPVVVDFHAGWCGPCKMLGPRLESLIAGKKGDVILAKIDIDENTELAVDHGVQAVPTVLAMKDGKVLDKFMGLKDEAELESFVNKLIGK